MSKLISTTDISKIAGLQIPSHLLKSLGHYPEYENNTSILWRRDQLEKMLHSLADYLIERAADYTESNP